MTICQFFLKGRCRFGENCRNEHSLNVGCGNNGVPGFDSQQLKNIIREIINEVILVEASGQWPLSCFAPIKEGQNVPGWEDYSPEEIRWKMYEARNKGTLNQCINEVKQLYDEAAKRRNALKQPTLENINLISNLIKMRKDSCAFNQSTTPFPSVSHGNSTFGGFSQAVTNNQGLFGGSGTTQSFGNIFGGSQQNLGNSGSIFGGNSTNFEGQTIFGSSQKAESHNMFSNSQTQSQKLFSTTPMNLSVSNQNKFPNTMTSLSNPNAENIFSSSGTSTTSIFAAQSQLYPGQSSGHSMHKDFFKGANENSQNNIVLSDTPVKEASSFIFDTPKTTHIGNQAQSNFKTNIFLPSQEKSIDLSAYSKTESLTPEELQAFSAATFTFGKIPLKPPPLESCS